MKSHNKRRNKYFRALLSACCLLKVFPLRRNWLPINFGFFFKSIFVTVKEENIVQPANRTFFVCLFVRYLLHNSTGAYEYGLKSLSLSHNWHKNSSIIYFSQGALSEDFGWFSIYHNCRWLLSYLILLLFVFDFKITDSSCLSFQFQGEFLSFFIQSLFHFSV